MTLSTQKEKLKQKSRIFACVTTKGSLSIWSNLIDWLLGSNGETPHFDVSSITDFCPRLRTKSPDLENPTIFRNYKPCPRPLMPDTGNTDPNLLEKLQQTEPQSSRKSQTIRAKPPLTLRPVMINKITLSIHIYHLYSKIIYKLVQ